MEESNKEVGVKAFLKVYILPCLNFTPNFMEPLHWDTSKKFHTCQKIMVYNDIVIQQSEFSYPNEYTTKSISTKKFEAISISIKCENSYNTTADQKNLKEILHK